MIDGDKNDTLYTRIHIILKYFLFREKSAKNKFFILVRKGSDTRSDVASSDA